MSADQPTAPEIDPAQLWCIWGWLPYVEHNPENPSLRFQSWVLASPDQAGIAQITGPRGHSAANVIAALSLEQLRQCLDLFQAPPDSASSSVLSRFISSIRTAPVHLVRRDGEVQFISNAQKRNDDDVLLSGSIQDLRRDVQEGERIVQERDYLAVSNDLRPITPERPKNWIWRWRDPQAYDKIRHLLEE